MVWADPDRLYCFLSVCSVKYLQLYFCDFCFFGGAIDSVWDCKGGK